MQIKANNHKKKLKFLFVRIDLTVLMLFTEKYKF